MLGLTGRSVIIKYYNGVGTGIIAVGSLENLPLSVLDESGEVITHLTAGEALSLTGGNLRDMKLVA